MSNKKSGKLSRDDLAAMQEQRSVQVAKVEEFGKTVRTGIVVVGVVGIFYCIHLAVADVAGRVTDANIAMQFLGNLQVSMALSWAVGLAGGAYGIQQNRLRRRTVHSLHSQIKGLETKIDPSRSSSDLSPTGDTNPGDA